MRYLFIISFIIIAYNAIACFIELQQFKNQSKKNAYKKTS